MSAAQAGITLIETLVTLSVIAFLAAIAIPTYHNYTVRARVSEALVWAGMVRNAVATAVDATGFAPANNLEVGLQPVPTDNSSPYVESITVTNGVITVELRNTGSAAADSGAIELVPDLSAGQIRWTCRTSGNVLFAYVPAKCRNVSSS